MKPYNDTLSNSKKMKSKLKQDSSHSGKNNKTKLKPNIGEIKKLPPFDLDSACIVHGCDINELNCAVNVCKVNEGKYLYNVCFKDLKVDNKSLELEKKKGLSKELIEKDYCLCDAQYCACEDHGAAPCCCDLVCECDGISM